MKSLLVNQSAFNPSVVFIMACSMERWVGKTAIVTGASAGIGYAIAQQLAEDGVKVVAVARRREKLEQLQKTAQGKKGTIYIFAADMTKEADILNLFKWTKENVGPIHILVNNAGVLRHTNLTEGKTQFWREVLDTNVLGLCIATREAVQDMKASKVDGHIIHINSIVGHRIVSFPNQNVYPATKHAVTALTETLRNELNSFGSRIKISSLSPGLVKTEIFEASVKDAVVKEGSKEEMKSFLENCPALTAQDIAEAVKYILATPPHVQIHELTIQPVGQLF